MYAVYAAPDGQQDERGCRLDVKQFPENSDRADGRW
jgi:hypothetical protein